MSLLVNESYANPTKPLWLSAGTPLPQGPTGATGPQGPQGFTSGAIYYFNKSQTDPTTGDFVMARTPLFNAGQTAVVNGPVANTVFAQFITPIGDPDVSVIPPGNWIFDIVMELNVPYTNQRVYAEIYTDDGVNPQVLIGSNQLDPVDLLGGANQELYTFGVSVPLTSVTPADRILVLFYVENIGPGETFTAYFENGTVAQVITSLSAGLQGPTGPTGPVGATGATGPQGPAGVGGTIARYGSFSDSTSQSILQNTAKAITLNTTEGSNGVTIGTPPSRIVITEAGTYDIQFSSQLKITSGSTEIITIWLRVNGVDVPRSSTDVSVKQEPVVAAWNFVYTFTAGQYFELMTSSTGAQSIIQAVGTRTGPTRPAVPSTILTVTQVTYTQIGPTGATGPAPANWSTYPATTNVDMAGFNIQRATNTYSQSIDFGGTSLLPLANLTTAGNFDGQGVYCKPLSGLGFVDINGTNWTGTTYALRSKGPVSLSGDGIISTISLGTNTIAGVDTTRIQLGVPVIGSIFMTAPSAIEMLATAGTLNFSGAVNLAAGGVLDLAGGTNIRINTSDVNCVNTTSGDQATAITCANYLAPPSVAATNPLTIQNVAAGGVVIQGVKQFDGLAASPAVMTNIASINGTPMTPIQTLQDVKPNGTQGGLVPVVAAYFQRELNTGYPTLTGGTDSTTIPGMELNTNVITLPTGKYYVFANLPACRVGRHKGRLYNITDAVVEILGQNAYANNSDFDQTHAAVISGVLEVVAGPKDYEVQQCVELTNGNYDLGLECNFGDDEVYTTITLTKLFA